MAITPDGKYRDILSEGDVRLADEVEATLDFYLARLAPYECRDTSQPLRERNGAIRLDSLGHRGLFNVTPKVWREIEQRYKNAGWEIEKDDNQVWMSPAVADEQL